MQVARYTFQSPYPNQVQIGRPDPSASMKDNSDKGLDSSITNKTMRDAKNFEISQTKEVKPEVVTNQLLDVYA